MSRPVIEQTIGHQAFQSWCYLVGCPETRQALLVDPGGSPEDILRIATGWTVQAIVLTHGHQDHWSGTTAVRRELDVPVWGHPGDADRIGFGLTAQLADDQVLRVGGLTAEVRHVPGHTDGSVALVLPGMVLTGDTLFPGGPGRTASPDHLRQVITSITTRLYTLPPAYTVLPGHGAATTIGASVEEYRVFASKPHPDDLCGNVEWLSS